MEDTGRKQKNKSSLDYMTSWSGFLMYIKEKIHHPGIQKHSKNIGWMFFAKIASMGISFLATVYIARNLGPTNYGQLSYALSFTGLFGFLASLGIEQILYRELIRYPEKRNEYMGSALVLRISAAILTIAICMLSAIILSPKDVSLHLILLISLSFFFSSFSLFGYEFQAEAKSKLPSILSFFVVIILNALKILVILYDEGVIYLALVILLEPILYAIGYLYLRTKKYGSVVNLRFDRKIATVMLRDSLPLIFASAFFAIYARIDQVMIKNMIDTESVGLYDSAVRIAEVWYFIPSMIIAALFPAIINAKKVSEELYYRRIRKIFILIVSISILTALPTTLLSKHIITIIYGTSFIGALSVLQIYVWSNIGAALSTLSQQLLIAENLTKMISISAFLGMVVNIVLNIFLIPRYGISGAAIASMISYTIPFLSLIFFRSSRKIFLNIFKI